MFIINLLLMFPILFTAFLTLIKLEELGYIQLHMAPNIGPNDLLQPIVNAIKLVIKEPL